MMLLVHVSDVEALVEVFELGPEVFRGAGEEGHVEISVGLAVDGELLVVRLVEVRRLVGGMGARHLGAVQGALEESVEDWFWGGELGVQVEEDGAVVHALVVRGGTRRVDDETRRPGDREDRPRRTRGNAAKRGGDARGGRDAEARGGGQHLEGRDTSRRDARG